MGVELPMSAPPRPQKRITKTALGFETEVATQGNIKTQNLLWCLHGAIGAAAAIAGVPMHVVGMKEWRAHTLGNGNIKGDESKRRCKAFLEKLGVYVANQDAAEAGGGLIWLNGHAERFEAEEKLLRSAA